MTDKKIYKDPYRRNLKVFRISNEALERILFGHGDYVLKSTLPEGTEIRNIRNSEEFDCLEFVLKSKTFPKVPEGDSIPLVDPEFQLMTIEQYDQYLLRKLKE